MSEITPTTQLRLINNLANLGTASSSDLFLIQKNLKSYKFQYSDLVSGLPDETTIEASSNKLQVKDLGISTGKIANNAVDFTKIRDIANNKLIGRTDSGSGAPQEVDIITDLGSASNTNIPTGSAVVNYINTNSKSFALLREVEDNGRFPNDQVSTNSSPTLYGTVDTDSIVNVTGTHNFDFYTRKLNEITINENNIIEDLTNREFRLSAGSYLLYGWIAHYDYVHALVRINKNNTPYAYSPIYRDSDNTGGQLHFRFYIEASGTDSERTFFIESGSSELNNLNDLGFPQQPSPNNEIYSHIEILKIG